MESKISDLYHDFGLVKEMKVAQNRKIRLLSELMGESPEHWRVVGVTEEALRVFKKYDFKKVSKMGINRSHHKMDRHAFYKEMLEKQFNNQSEWWGYYIEKDITILSTASENAKNEYSTQFEIQESGLFRSRGYSWVHNRTEMQYLEKLYLRFIIGD